MCVFVVFMCCHPIYSDVRLVDVPAGVPQEEVHTGFLYPPSAMLALIFLARRIQPFLPLVDRNKVDFLCTNELIVLHLMSILFFVF